MAIENGVQNAELGYILDPAFQIENLNGKPVVGGYICIYEAGTDNKYISYENFDGAQNPFKIPLKADGRAVILGDPSLTYDVYFYDSYGNQLFSRLNVQCNVPGNISIKGADTRIKNTDGTLDISLQTMGNNVREYTVNTRNKILNVQEPLYFVENSNTATIIGFSGDGYVTKDKFEYDDNYNITGYDGSAFASNGQTYSAGTNIDITDNVISVTGLPTSSDVENAISSAVTNVENKFEYNTNNYITAYNNSAFAGTNYSAGNYVDITNDTISVTGLQPSGDYATKTDLESATSGKMDVTGMTAYQPTGDYATHDDLTAYQPAGNYLSASESANYYPMTGNPSGFLTNDAITGLQPSGDYVTHDEMTAYQPTGDYATHDDLTGYATTSLVSSVSSELYSAISGISGDYELVAGSGVELVDDPNAKTTTINVTAEGTPVTAIEQMIESATSGLQPSGDYATTADLNDYVPMSGITDGSEFARLGTYGLTFSSKLNNNASSYSNFTNVISNYIRSANVPSYAANIELSPTALYLHQSSAYGSAYSGYASLNRNALELKSVNGAAYIGLQSYNLLSIYTSGNYQQPNFIAFDRGNGLSYSSENTGIGRFYTVASSDINVPRYNPVWFVKNGSGDGFSIGASEARGFDKDGNTIWSTKQSKATQLIHGSNDPNPAILLTPMPTTTAYTAQWTAAPYVSADYQSLTLSYGPTASVPNIKIMPDGITAQILTGNSARAWFGLNVGGAKFENSAGIWSLTGSVQKTDIAGDSATSAITSIAGSAIGGGVAQSAFDELKQSYDALSALFATYSGQWLLPNEGEE